MMLAINFRRPSLRIFYLHSNRRAPGGGNHKISRLPQATEYQEEPQGGAAFSYSGPSAFCGARSFSLGAGPIPPAARGESLGNTLELAASRCRQRFTSYPRSVSSSGGL